MNVRVFIVDDQPTFRAGLRVALNATENVEIVGEAASGTEAVDVLSAVPGTADVVLMDVSTGGSSSIEALQLISGEVSAPRVLVMSIAGEDDLIIGALRAGARGVLDKGASRRELLHSIHLVAHGGAAFSALTAARLGTYFSAMRWGACRLAFPELTERETQILDLLAQGRNNRSIARALCLAEKTVRNNISSVYAKLHVADRTTAALRARQAGLGADALSES